VDWDELGFNQHEAWRCAEFLARYELDPSATAQSLAKAIPADVTTVRRWRRACIRVRLLKQRVRKTKFGKSVTVDAFDVQWANVEKRRNVEFAGRTLAPERAAEPLSRSAPDEDRRTPEEREWCAVLTHEDVNLSPHEWAAFNALWAAQGTRSFTTYEKMAARLGRSTRRAIDRVMPALQREKLVTVKLHSGGKDGRESEVVFNARKIELAAAGRPKASATTPRAAMNRELEKVRESRHGSGEVSRTTKKRGRKPKWEHLTKQLAVYLAAQPDAKPAELRTRYKAEYSDHPLPSPRTTTMRSIMAKIRASRVKSPA
jgi:hypothetical protein